MGIQGTEVAKESSDIIILDDNFASVVKVGILFNIFTVLGMVLSSFPATLACNYLIYSRKKAFSFSHWFVSSGYYFNIYLLLVLST